MLNYIWIGLVLIGVIVALGKDVNDEARNTYRNGVVMEATVEFQKTPSALRSTWEGEIVLPAGTFNQFYGVTETKADVRQPVVISKAPDEGATLQIALNASAPERWREIATSSSSKDKLSGMVRSIQFAEDNRSARVQIVLEPIHFMKMKAVTNAALDYAKTAVNITLGLIGIMALWLGVMKVAEEAGLVRVLTRLLTPLSKRLFPDVPSDHPAIGAMIMNIAANMLGLSNAATPLGLKAMEELNKLNPKIGTATNAMCTFLAINTAGLVLIPATAIAVRAAAGSSNPGIIIGTSIFGAGCASVAGLIAVKLLEKLPHYKNQLLPDDDTGKEESHG